MWGKKKKKEGSKKQPAKKRYAALFRYMNALTILCFLVSIAANIRAGATSQEIAWRGFEVIVIFSIASRLIITCWTTWLSWEETRKEEADNIARALLQGIDACESGEEGSG